MLRRYRVWDKLNETSAQAAEIDAESPEVAAELYAEKDADGQIDGIYEERSGHVLIVQAGPDEAYECVVRLEYTHHYDVNRRPAS